MTKILVVDDEPNIVYLLTEFLKSMEYEVITAANGDEALEKVRQESPQVVLLDVNLPGKTGIEILREIKQEKPGTSVIMVTAVTEQDIGRRALELGAFDYILKPFDFEYLGRVLQWQMKLL